LQALSFEASESDHSPSLAYNEAEESFLLLASSGVMIIRVIIITRLQLTLHVLSDLSLACNFQKTKPALEVWCCANVAMLSMNKLVKVLYINLMFLYWEI